MLKQADFRLFLGTLVDDFLQKKYFFRGKSIF